jgi:hypothetical protein
VENLLFSTINISGPGSVGVLVNPFRRVFDDSLLICLIVVFARTQEISKKEVTLNGISLHLVNATDSSCIAQRGHLLKSLASGWLLPTVLLSDDRHFSLGRSNVEYKKRNPW